MKQPHHHAPPSPFSTMQRTSIKALTARPATFEFARRPLDRDPPKVEERGISIFRCSVNPCVHGPLSCFASFLVRRFFFLKSKSTIGHMAITSDTSATIVVRTWTVMIIFCFAGCAAGSCLSYGHSCWGAHGKRSGGHNNNAYIVAPRTVNDVQDIPLFTKEQWILFRLIGRPSMSTKYRERWDRPFKIKTHLSQHSDRSNLNAHVISDESTRDKSNNQDGDDDARRNINDMSDLVESISDERQEIPEILLISNNENNGRGRKPQNIELVKFLSNSNDNFE